MLGLSSGNAIRGSMASSKASRASKHHQVVFWFMGAWCACLFVYQHEMFMQLHETEGSERRCDEEGPDLDSPQCVETHLFRSWKRIELEEPPEYFNETVEDLERLAQQRLMVRIETLTSPPTPSSDEKITTVPITDDRTPPVPESADLTEKMDKLYSDTMAVLSNEPLITGFDQQLMDSQAGLEAKMERLPSTEQRHHQQRQEEYDRLYNHTWESIHIRENTTSEYAQEMTAMMEQSEAREREMLTELKKKAAKRQERLAKLHNDAVSAKHRSLTASEALGGSTAHPTATPQRGFLSVDDRHSWVKLLSSLKGAAQANTLVEVDHAQLVSVNWQGRLPMVACVVAISSGSDARAQIDHVIKNFRLQSYDEGQRQLVLLYPHSDAEVAALVREHTDGKFIKGVAAPNSGSFPSTTALRYAAWSVDADIIARWNVDDVYDHDRLLMQFRALALTSRPVSLLKSWKVVGSEAARSGRVLSDDVGWEGSIFGEATWMKEHWMPLLQHERQVLGGVQAHAVVQVDMPELSVYLMHDDGWAGALRHFGLPNSTFEPPLQPLLF